ncbi:MAG: multicopper oxidase domain-containing protein, partial [Pikeienuella sp.]
MEKTDKMVQSAPSRRNLLQGAMLSGAAVMVGGKVQAAMTTRPSMAARPPMSSPLIRAQAEEIARAKPVDLSGLERVRQELVAPPFAPEHEQVATRPPRIVEIEMITEEKLMVVDEDTGAEVWALTYNGSVPGPLIIVHQDDYVELTLRNPLSSQMDHNIDFHASTGALGGGALTHIYPGEEAVLRWKAVKAGLFTYHCAPGGEMIPYHVCHGMNGAIMVLPRDGLTDPEGNPLRYDRIAYLGEQDYYLPVDANGEYRSDKLAGDVYTDSIAALRTLTPTQSVCNGAVGALTGEDALRA